MTDIELLEFAAKAAGFRQYISRHLGRSSFVVYDEEAYSETKERRVLCEKTLDWNPLTDDGDAFRLKVKLEIDIMYTNIFSPRVHAMADYDIEVTEESKDDPFAATRRAIVRAAAEIGRQMP